MKTTKIILFTLSCLAGATVLHSCKAKTVEPDTDQKRDTTNISINRIPKKITVYGRDTGSTECGTCKEEQLLSYDARGNISKIVHSYYKGTQLVQNAETNYQWNNDKLVRKSTRTPGKHDETSTYSYNAQGKLTEYAFTGSLSDVTKYFYAANGKLVNIISKDDSSYVEEGIDSVKLYTFRKHSGDGSWIHSVDHTYTKRGNVLTMKEVGYAASLDKEITLSSEYTYTLTFSTIPITKAMQQWMSEPDVYPYPSWDYYPAHRSSSDTWWGTTTTDECPFANTEDKYKRVTEVDLKCDDYRYTVEY